VLYVSEKTGLRVVNNTDGSHTALVNSIRKYTKKKPYLAIDNIAGYSNLDSLQPSLKGFEICAAAKFDPRQCIRNNAPQQFYPEYPPTK